MASNTIANSPSEDVEAAYEEAQSLVREEGEEEENSWWDDRSVQTRILQGVAIACAVVNIVAIAIAQGATIIIAGLVAILVSGAVFYFQLQIADDDCK
jgi:hypothetical protein